MDGLLVGVVLGFEILEIMIGLGIGFQGLFRGTRLQCRYCAGPSKDEFRLPLGCRAVRKVRRDASHA